ncbi:MAG: PAS domain-containing sensor histidine kinase, partial [Gammaproteobacteria bacterium]|nr:PAS domain-containing sensor histidine kinase [Gammaproteobacteria bacterium]NIR93257.1 PAS domain-containing sensor histidine kinase [Gammaproteobacteria bacterium]
NNYFQRISRSAEKMQALIDALLKFAHLRRSPINKEYRDLSEMSQDIVDELRSQYPE